MAYATATDLINRYDARRLGDLVLDDDTREASASLASNLKVSEALSDASGAVRASAFVGKRYNSDDLAALADDDLAYLKRITCDLAFGYLLQRRGYNREEVSEAAPGFYSALGMLRQLRDGELIFGGVTKAATAGVKVSVVEQGKDRPGVTTANRLFGSLSLENRRGD